MNGRTVVFVGPTLGTEAVLAALPDAEVLGPAAHGDLHRAAVTGAGTIVLIDGLFESVRSVWHKEILAALARGVRVIGASSMGALRAAECAAFGMEPVGVIAHAYLTGERTSDADVAVAHADASGGYRPISEALVNVEATVAAARAAGVLHPDAAAVLEALARRQFYAQRTWPWLLTEARRGLAPDDTSLDGFAAWLRHGAVDQKAIDAREALGAAARPASPHPVPAWSLARTGYWEAAESEVARRVDATGDARHLGRHDVEFVLDELRLDPLDHRLVSLAGQARRLAERLHESSGLTVAPEDTAAALAELRQRLRLGTAADVNRWRADQGLGTDAFRSLVTGEAKHRWAERRHLADRDRATVVLLQRDARWSALRTRAAAKNEVLDRFGIDDVEAARRAGPDLEVLAWWWQSHGEAPPADIATHLADHGYDDPAALLRALRRERVYRELVCEGSHARS